MSCNPWKKYGPSRISGGVVNASRLPEDTAEYVLYVVPVVFESPKCVSVGVDAVTVFAS